MSFSDFHSRSPIEKPDGWIMYVSHSATKRLVVFVHGFQGKATTTWDDFRRSGKIDAWWRESDMLFIAYDSTKDNTAAVASRIRRLFPSFYPRPFSAAMTIDGAAARADTLTEYSELIILGHSLGGLIVRRAIADSVQAWKEDEAGSPRPKILDAQVRLFSPAIKGFQATGWAGAAYATPLKAVAELRLKMSPAYMDLQPGSPILVETCTRTEQLAEEFGSVPSLRPRIVWANPENVVITERYSTDLVDEFIDDTSHITVCKPNDSYMHPWTFAQTGRL